MPYATLYQCPFGYQHVFIISDELCQRYNGKIIIEYVNDNRMMKPAGDTYVYFTEQIDESEVQLFERVFGEIVRKIDKAPNGIFYMENPHCFDSEQVDGADNKQDYF